MASTSTTSGGNGGLKKRKRGGREVSKEEEEAAEMVKALNLRIASEGEKITRELLPQKILQLQKLIEQSEFFVVEKAKQSVLEDVQLQDGISVFNSSSSTSNMTVEEITEGNQNYTANGSVSVQKPSPQGTSVGHDDDESLAEIEKNKVPCNQYLLDIMDLLKKEILASVQMIGTVKIWIQLLIPRIEDGNNFGVGVQEECVSELGRVEDQCFAVLESMTKYFTTRAKLVAKYIKHRTVMDYRQSIIECDEMQYINLRMGAIDLRNNYTIMYDLLLKNLDRIKRPKGSVDPSSILL